MSLSLNLKKIKNNKMLFIFLKIKGKMNNNIGFIGLFRVLFCFSFFSILSSCYGVRSKYSEKITNNEKICLFINIYNEYHRNYLNKLKEQPNVSEMPDCDYLLYSNIDFIKSSQATVSGVYFTETIKASTYYKLYKFDKERYKEITDIINTPDIVAFKKSTGILQSSLSRNKTFNEMAREQVEKVALNSSIKMMEKRLDDILDIVGMNTFTDVSSYTNNLIIITSNIQSQKDAKKQLINSASQRVMDYVLLDILKYREGKNKKD